MSQHCRPDHTLCLMSCTSQCINKVLIDVMLLQPELDTNKALVVHAASSCTYPANYYHLMRTIVFPYWNADPPEHRLSKKNYKSVDHPTAWVPEDSFAFKVRFPLPAYMADDSA